MSLSKSTSSSSSQIKKSSGYNSILSLWHAYLQQLRKNPILTKAITAAVVSASGNLVAQVLVERGRLDLARLIKFSIIGLISAPLSHFKFLFLEVLFHNKKGHSGLYGKIAVDQIIFGPIFTVVFYALLAILDGQPGKMGQLIKQNAWQTQVTSWKVWPIASWINFNFIPNELRVLFVNVIGFFWVIVLSSLANRNKKK
jgi:hypothetical protein